MWYVLDRDDEIIAAYEDEPSAISNAHASVERMVANGVMRACVFVVSKAHFDAALQEGESPRRWRSYKTGRAQPVRPSMTSVCR